MPMVALQSVAKSFGSVEVLHDINLAIESGEFVVFVGPSGSGKSTLLRIVAGLEEATGGHVLIEGTDVTFAEPSQRGIAMVFQSYALYPHMNVEKNMAFNLELSRFSRTAIRERVREAARILQLEDLLQRTPAQLSGGQRQRVAIGRAIVRHPRVFLFDEPLSNLDAALRVQMRLEIERLHQELGTTMIYVTHDQVEAMTLADRIVVLDRGEIQQIGAPLELYKRPANRFVAEFIGSPRMNVVETGRLPDLAGAKAHALGVRPENMRVTSREHDAADAGVRFPARTRSVERLGNINFGYFETGGGDQLVAQFTGETDLRGGAEVTLSFDPSMAHEFAADGTTIRSPELPAAGLTSQGGNHV